MLRKLLHVVGGVGVIMGVFFGVLEVSASILPVDLYLVNQEGIQDSLLASALNDRVKDMDEKQEAIDDYLKNEETKGVKAISEKKNKAVDKAKKDFNEAESKLIGEYMKEKGLKVAPPNFSRLKEDMKNDTKYGNEIETIEKDRAAAILTAETGYDKEFKKVTKGLLKTERGRLLEAEYEESRMDLGVVNSKIKLKGVGDVLKQNDANIKTIKDALAGGLGGGIGGTAEVLKNSDVSELKDTLQSLEYKKERLGLEMDLRTEGVTLKEEEKKLSTIEKAQAQYDVAEAAEKKLGEITDGMSSDAKEQVYAEVAEILGVDNDSDYSIDDIKENLEFHIANEKSFAIKDALESLKNDKNEIVINNQTITFDNGEVYIDNVKQEYSKDLSSFLISAHSLQDYNFKQQQDKTVEAYDKWMDNVRAGLQEEVFHLSALGADDYVQENVKKLGVYGLFVNVIRFLIFSVGLLAVLGICIGGVMILISAGSENLLQEGKTAIFYSVIGLVVVLLSYALVQTVQTFVYGIVT